MHTEAPMAGKSYIGKRLTKGMLLVPACLTLVCILLVASWLFITTVQFFRTSPDVTAANLPKLMPSTHPAFQGVFGKYGPAAPCIGARDALELTSTANSNTSSIPIKIASCINHTSSSFPYIGNDIFLDSAHQVFMPRAKLDLKGPSIIYLHPKDIPAFAAFVPQLRHRVVLVSNSNADECLPWGQGDENSGWRHHADTILNSSMVVSW